MKSTLDVGVLRPSGSIRAACFQTCADEARDDETSRERDPPVDPGKNVSPGLAPGGQCSPRRRLSLPGTPKDHRPRNREARSTAPRTARSALDGSAEGL